jgi:glycosyltransferase involved in cell wall biosynthesis
MKVSVIIPVFNEERSIAGVLDEILALDLAPHELEVIVSDDGSFDGTAERVVPYADRGERVKTVASTANRGKGAAIRLALEVATGDLVLIQDADTEYSPADYPRLLDPIVEGDAEVVYGSRFLDRRWPRGMRPQNWLANRLFTSTANFLYGGSISDEGIGYKVFRRELLESLHLEATGFEFCAEVTAKLLRRGIAIQEVPVSYRARGGSWTGSPGYLDGLRVLWTLVRYRVSGAHDPRPPVNGE